MKGAVGLKRLTQAERDTLKDMVYVGNGAILQLLNWYPDNQGFLHDGYDGSIIAIEGKQLKLFKAVEHMHISFHPFYNSKLMGYLFGWFTRQLEEQEGRVIEYWEFGPGNMKKDKLVLKVKETGYPELETGAYTNVSIRFFDAMCALAEIDPPFDLETFDTLIK